MGPAPILVDSTAPLPEYAEARARQAVWRRRERELVGDGTGLPGEAPERPERPTPFPDGPVEKLGDRTALASLLGAGGVLAFTRDPGRAGELMLATMPKAARQGREAFAAALDACWRGTASSRWTAPACAGWTGSGWPYRFHGPVLHRTAHPRRHRPRPRVRRRGSLAGRRGIHHRRRARRPAAPRTVDHRRVAHRAAADAAPDRRTAPAALTVDLLDGKGARAGRARIGVEPDPLADALLAAARDAAENVVLTEHDSVGDLLAWADDVVARGRARRTARHDPRLPVRRQRRAGPPPATTPRWTPPTSALVPSGTASVLVGRPDLRTGPGEAWRVLRAVATATPVSERSSRLALGGCALGALLTVAVDGRRRPRGR